MNKDMSLDTTCFDHPTYSHLNALQYAALQGDVKLLEGLVSLGAALDYAYDSANSTTTRRNDSMKTKKPPGSTALLFALVGVLHVRQSLAIMHATRGLAVGDEEETLRKMYEEGVECAVQLVRLGANVNVRFQLPTGRDANSRYYEMARTNRWVGKQCGNLRLRRALNCWSRQLNHSMQRKKISL
mmetsp:Transcript_37986/g.68398  ORF Transcript_37986/g.68398 Transcript_37986/m.68398 type:complete len:185 (-) Transcript_37986:1206-1760(-)